MGAIQLLCKKGILLSQGHMAGMGAIEEMVPLYLNSFASRGNERGGPSKELVIAIESATMTVEEGRSWLLIEVAVTTPTPLSCEIEFHLLNTQGVPVAFSTSWAPKLRAALQFKSGETHQRWRLDVSHLANGHYILKAQLQLPMEKVLASCEAEGSVQVYRPPLNGKIRALEQSWCVGGVELNLELLPDRSS